MRTFHDAVVVRFTTMIDRVEIDIEGVSSYTGNELNREAGKLIVQGVSCITENQKQVDGPSFTFDDGQILDLEMDNRCLKLLVEWESYSSNSTDVAEYEIHGDSIRWVPAIPDRLGHEVEP